MKKKEALQNISCFVAGMSVAIILQFAIPQLIASFKHHSPPEPAALNTNVVECVDIAYTNRPAAKPNVDWFKTGSDYIWDDWKLR